MRKQLSKILKEKNFLSLSSSVSVAALGLISFMLLTRGLPKEKFGDWVLYVTIATFFDLLRFGLTSTALVRFASGRTEDVKRVFMGTSYKIGLRLVVAVSLILWPIYIVISHFDVQINNGYRLFLLWYPLLALLNLSWNNSVSYFQAEQKFKHILFIRLLNIGSFVLFLLLNNFILKLGLMAIVIAHLVSNLLPSILVFAKKWDGLFYMKRSTKESQKEMINFGKFSMGTLIGSSLLRSADTFIIGLSPFLGSVGIAQYAIPLKLTDMLGIPLRSFTITAYPKMSAKSHQNDIPGLKKIFYGYSGVVTALFIPVAILGFIFAEELVWFLGGNEYADSLTLLANIFRIFALYSILLPIDRFTGVALDSINKPKFNFYKVIIMASANIVGDLIAVFVFESLEAVAIVTVVFTLIGILAGYYYLNKEIKIEFKRIFTESISLVKNIKNSIL